MLGEVVSETKGKITSQRVLSAEGPKIEASFTSVGKLKGIEVTEMATFWSTQRPGGALFGEGNGVMMAADGELASWSGNGIGKFGAGGKQIWRGAVYLQTPSTGKFASLNNAVLVFEFEADAMGNTSEKAWEWK
jgi:hypothetical protein